VSAADTAGTETVSTATTAPPAGPGPVSGDGTEPVAEVAAAVAPAVVQIETNDGLGSGFVYDEAGLILTAAHVVGQSGGVDVRLADGSLHRGEVLGADSATDVAVVQIDPPADMAVAELATGVTVQVGQLAVAIGSPFGLDQTVTSGIVSAVDRPVTTPGGAVNMIQTDAPINPGNSGGALVDRQGRVIGINDSIATESGSNAGVGFAIPIDLAKAVADRLVAGEDVEFAFLGVSTSAAVGDDGPVVVEVERNSPADDAGLQRGDRIVALDGEAVRDQIELVARVRAHQPGDEVELTIERDGDTETVRVTLGSTNS
jgi:putative serine protease PepD